MSGYCDVMPPRFSEPPLQALSGYVRCQSRALLPHAATAAERTLAPIFACSRFQLVLKLRSGARVRARRYRNGRRPDRVHVARARRGRNRMHGLALTRTWRAVAEHGARECVRRA